MRTFPLKVHYKAIRGGKWRGERRRGKGKRGVEMKEGKAQTNVSENRYTSPKIDVSRAISDSNVAT